MEKNIEQLFGLFADWLNARWPAIGGAKLAISGQHLIFGARSKKEQFDWDFADTLADLDAVILNDEQYKGLEVETISLIIFDHYVSAHLNEPTVFEYDGSKWNEKKWP